VLRVGDGFQSSVDFPVLPKEDNFVYLLLQATNLVVTLLFIITECALHENDMMLSNHVGIISVSSIPLRIFKFSCMVIISSITTCCLIINIFVVVIIFVIIVVVEKVIMITLVFLLKAILVVFLRAAARTKSCLRSFCAFWAAAAFFSSFVSRSE
jgi:hypothetical protein